ncbi:MAG: acyl-CoA carboxylase epsilon subunit [Actinomycetes bacterium]
MSIDDESSSTPMLRIVRGNPSAEDVAAVVAVLSAAAAQPLNHKARKRSSWSSPHRTLRQPLTTGGWHASAQPR